MLAVTALASLLSATASCGLGSVGVAASASDSRTRTVERTPTAVALITPEDGQSGRVTLPVRLDVDEAEELEIVSIEYSLRGDVATAYRTATPARGFPAEIVEDKQLFSGAALSKRRARFVPFVWNSHYDLDGLRAATNITRPVTARAVLRVTVRNTTTGETLTEVTDEFFLDHSLMETVAGGGVGDGTLPQVASMLNPTGIATDANGNVFVADTGNHRIRAITRENVVAKTIDTVVGNGFRGATQRTEAATRTSMDSPAAIAVWDEGAMFLAETGPFGGSQLRFYEQETGLLSNFMSGFVGISALSLSPDRVLYIADEGGNAVYSVDLDGIDPSLDPPGPSLFVGGFEAPSAVVALEEATIYVAKRRKGQVVRKRGAELEVVVAGAENGADPSIGAGALDVKLVEPAGLAATTSHYFIADVGAEEVLVVDVASNQIVNILDEVSGSRPLDQPVGLAVDERGNLFIVETGDGSIASDSSGHQVVMASSPESPTDALVLEFACGSSIKELAQALDGLDTEIIEIDLLRRAAEG